MRCMDIKGRGGTGRRGMHRIRACCEGLRRGLWGKWLPEDGEVGDVVLSLDYAYMRLKIFPSPSCVLNSQMIRDLLQ